MNIKELIEQFKRGGQKASFSHKDVSFILEQIDAHTKGSEIIRVVYKDIEKDKVVFEEEVLKCDLPKTGEAIIKDGYHWKIATIWHDKDENIVEVDLNDL